MKHRKRLTSILSLLLLAAVLLSGCGRGDALKEGAFYIYFKNSTKRELFPVEAVIDEQASFDSRIASVWKHMVSGADHAEYTSPVPATVSLKNYTLQNNNLNLNFDQPYLSLSSPNEVLFRASLVKTFTQFPEIQTVEISVENQPLVLSNGSVVGPMKGSDCIDVLATGLNAYSETVMDLYFTNETADGLISESVRIRYNNTIPLEQAVVRNLINGPESADLYPTIPNDTKLISVSTKNGTCYVNLNEVFLNRAMVSRPEIAVYSLVNSLTEIVGINAVSISVNGSSNVMFMDQFDLSAPLYRNTNFDLIQAEPSESAE